MKYLKSPLNYTGGKYKLLSQILPLFPKDINYFYDMFCGGLNVTLNVDADKYVCNDNLYQVIEIYKLLKELGYEKVLTSINSIINEFGLNKENKEGYLKLRNRYNSNKNILDLLVLIFHSFNNQIRFNSSDEFNMPFGENRSSFNSSIDKNLNDICSFLNNNEVYFSSFDTIESVYHLDCGEKDLCYFDPPYLISTATYNKEWDNNIEHKFLESLDYLNSKNTKFALSNVLYHKGLENNILIEWSKKYNVHYLDVNYKNASYHKIDKQNNSIEVLITNY